jgi:hypothetical protein
VTKVYSEEPKLDESIVEFFNTNAALTMDTRRLLFWWEKYDARWGQDPLTRLDLAPHVSRRYPHPTSDETPCSCETVGTW